MVFSERTTRGLRWRVVAMAVLGVVPGCTQVVHSPRCSQGESLSDGQCIPTATLVFERCVNSFRRTTQAHSEGKRTRVAARAKGYGATEIEHGHVEEDRAEYSGIPDALMPEALAECRRQQEQERTHQLELAWAAAQTERERAAAAQRQTRGVQKELAASAREVQTLTESLNDSREQIDAFAAAAQDADARWDEQQQALAEHAPCWVQAWERCGEQALAAKDAGQLARAHELFERACDGGDGTACANWGLMLEQGLGTDADPVAALSLYRQACGMGLAQACASEGIMVAAGQGTSADPDTAALRLGTACGDGVPRACAHLGRLVDAGTAKARDSRWTARRLYGRACDGGDAHGCRWLGDYHRLGGQEREPQPRKAAVAYERACNADDAAGCLRLAELYDVGDGVNADPAKARALADRACRGGLSLACAWSGRLQPASELAGLELR